MKRLHIPLAAILIVGLVPLGALAGDGPVPGASSPRNVQGGENRIELQSILHIQTTDTTNSVIRALDELGYAYDLINSSDWTGIDFSPYDIVIVGMDGGAVEAPSIQKIRTDVVDQGKRAIFLGGTCYQPFAIGVNDYLVLNDFNDYCWAISSTPHWTLVDPGHGLAMGLPDTYDFANSSAAYYQMRATDPAIEVVSVNGDGYDQFFYKGDNFPMTEGGITQDGDFIWFIDSVYSYYWENQADFDLLKQLIANAITYSPGPEPPPNDECANATVVDTLPFTDVLDTTEATTAPDDPETSCGSGGYPQQSHSVWYSFTPQSDGLAYVATCGSDYDTVLAMFEGPCGEPWVEIACNDDSCGLQSELIDIPLVGGMTYLIEVMAYDDGSAGMLDFYLDYAPTAEPDIRVEPEALLASQCPDEITEQTLSVCNDGMELLEWSLSEVPGLLGRAQLPEKIAGANSDDAGAFAVVASKNRIAAGPVLIIQDQYPWGYTSIQDILTANGIAYDQVDSTQIPTIDLNPYGLVIIPSNQTSGFYTTWNDNIAKFEAYVGTGKALWMSTCAYTSTTPEPLVPGGVVNGNDLDNYNVVLEPGHPWVQGVSNPFYGNYASHDSFTNLYPGTIEVCEAQTSGNATLLDYMMGTGRILATGQTLEWAWGNGYEGGLILENSLLDMYAWAPGDDVPWLSEDPTEGAVDPGTCQDVTVTFDSTGLDPGVYAAELLIESNDPDEPEVLVPVELTVELCEATMHVEAITGQFEYPFLLMMVQVAAHDGMPLGDVYVDATVTMPFAEWMRWRYTRPNGWARFWGLLVETGNYEICVENLTLTGYTYNPDENVVTCMDWDYLP